MISELSIENFRGIASLEVNGLARINLVVGGNGSGKTSLLAAAAMGTTPINWVGIAAYLDDPRLPPVIEAERHLVPLCPGGDQTLRPTVTVTRSGVVEGLSMAVTKARGRAEYDVRFVQHPGGEETAWVDKGRGLVFANPLGESSRVWWSPGFVEAESVAVDGLVAHYRAGTTESVVKSVRLINPDVEAIEVVGADLFVRLVGRPLPMRFGVLGDGSRRMLEFALALAGKNSTVAIDELENGFHYSKLPLLMRLLRDSPTHVQVFASTHREEVIRAACEVFLDGHEDALRIIRVDRSPTGHRAVVYTPGEALEGLESGLELRG